MIRNPQGLKLELYQSAISVEAQCLDMGFELLIYCTFRSFQEQSRCYRKGRSLATINQKALQLRAEYGRPDLAKTLIDVGPQKGRSIVTNAGPGQSLHNYKMAFDAVPMVDGKPVWGNSEPEHKKLWQQYGDAVVNAGLIWAGNWSRFKEYPHAQMANANWRELINKS